MCALRDDPERLAELKRAAAASIGEGGSWQEYGRRAAEHYRQPDVLVAPGATGDLALVDNAIEDSGCASPLAAHPATAGFDLVVRGGRYAAGTKSNLPVPLQSADVVVERGASFTDIALDFGRGSRGVVARLRSL